ncbi:MAG: outer membrane beta-barrel protein [Bacteroidales bacterium]|nr:outer membrane beta-barrel protein [Bacteroidales bacterium]
MRTKVMLSIALSLLVTVLTFGQGKENRFGIEINGEVSFVSTDLAGASLNTGLGFETILQYRFMPFTSVYGGWGWVNFNADESFAGPDMDFEQTGYILGLQFMRQIGSSPVSYFARAGLLYSHIETENNDGDIISNTGHGVGYQVAGGIEVAMGNNWSLAPGIKFNSLSGETEIEGMNYQLDHRYVSARIGVIKRF